MTSKRQQQPCEDDDQQHYDVVILGAGPAGLSCLSAIQEPFSLDTVVEAGQLERAHRRSSQRQGQRRQHRQRHGYQRRKQRRIAVVDPHPTWMSSWQHRFRTLDIRFLRSTAMAHPNLFDGNALLAYAHSQNRTHELLESGCGNLRSLLPLGQSQVGLWNLPSTPLFTDFCLNLSQSLEHDYICDVVIDVKPTEAARTRGRGNNATTTTTRHHHHTDAVDAVDDDDDGFTIMLKSGKRRLFANAVILAMGSVGIPIVPQELKSIPLRYIQQWTDLSQLFDNNDDDQLLNKMRQQHKSDNGPDDASRRNDNNNRTTFRILVVGGGLTAVQAAIRCCNVRLPHQKTHVTLCSRRPLVLRHFDLPLEWFDRRTTNKCMSDFYHSLDWKERLEMINSTRDGGSIPPVYMKQLNDYVSRGKIQLQVATAEYVEVETKHNAISNDNDDNDKVRIQFRNGAKHETSHDMCTFDKVVLACGVQPNCRASPLVEKLLDTWPLDVVGGFPCICQDLQWTRNLYVVGGLGSLSIGPDAANLMGMRRAAQVVANALDCRSWLRTSNVLENPFHVLDLGSSDDGSTDDDDDEDDDSSETPQLSEQEE